MTPITGLRERARAEIIAAIKAEARRQLAIEGAAGLSLRAVARELGMVSSGIYRYVAGRDELLTMLIIDAYDALGAEVERAAENRGRSGRSLARRGPGDPVVGDRPSARVRLALRLAGPRLRRAGGHDRPGVANDAGACRHRRRCASPRTRPHGRADEGPAWPGHGSGGRPCGRRSRDPDDVFVRTIAAWTQLFGLVSFECSVRPATSSSTTTSCSTPRSPPWRRSSDCESAVRRMAVVGDWCRRRCGRGRCRGRAPFLPEV